MLVTQPHLKEGRVGHEAKLSHSSNTSLDINCIVTLFLYALPDFDENFPSEKFPYKQVLNRNIEKNARKTLVERPRFAVVA